MFRKPVRLEKWIAFDGAVGAEVVDAVLQILDADAESFDNDSANGNGDDTANPDGQPPAHDGEVDVEVSFVQPFAISVQANGTDYVDQAPDWYEPHHLYDLDEASGCDIDGNQGLSGQDIHFIDNSEDATIDNDANSFLPFWKNDSDQGSLEFALLYKDPLKGSDSDHFSTWHNIENLDFVLTPSEGGLGLLDLTGLSGEARAEAIRDFIDQHGLTGSGRAIAFMDGDSGVAGYDRVVKLGILDADAGTIDALAIPGSDQNAIAHAKVIENADGTTSFGFRMVRSDTAQTVDADNLHAVRMNAILKSLVYTTPENDAGSHDVTISGSILYSRDNKFNPVSKFGDFTYTRDEAPEPPEPPPENPNPPGPTDPTDPTDPIGPTDPTEPLDPTEPGPRPPILPPDPGDGPGNDPGDGPGDGPGSDGPGADGPGDPGSGPGASDSGDGGNGGEGGDGLEVGFIEQTTDDSAVEAEVRGEANRIEEPIREETSNSDHRPELESAEAAAIAALSLDFEAMYEGIQSDRTALEDAMAILHDEYRLLYPAVVEVARGPLRQMFAYGGDEIVRLRTIIDLMERQMSGFRSRPAALVDGMMQESIRELLITASVRSAETNALAKAFREVAQFLQDERAAGRTELSDAELASLFENARQEALAAVQADNALKDPMRQEWVQYQASRGE